MFFNDLLIPPSLYFTFWRQLDIDTCGYSERRIIPVKL